MLEHLQIKHTKYNLNGVVIAAQSNHVKSPNESSLNVALMPLQKILMRNQLQLVFPQSTMKQLRTWYLMPILLNATIM